MKCNNISGNAIVSIEHSAMAVVFCDNKILSIKENIYGTDVLSLPKGHQENNETYLQTAIRECYEETGVVIDNMNFKSQLNDYYYEYISPKNIHIKKTIHPYLFELDKCYSPSIKEERIKNIEWLNIDYFLRKCSYDNVKNVVNEALSKVKEGK